MFYLEKHNVHSPIQEILNGSFGKESQLILLNQTNSFFFLGLVHLLTFPKAQFSNDILLCAVKYVCISGEKGIISRSISIRLWSSGERYRVMDQLLQ